MKYSLYAVAYRLLSSATFYFVVLMVVVAAELC